MERFPICQHPKVLQCVVCQLLPLTLNLLFLGWKAMIVHHEKCISHFTECVGGRDGEEVIGKVSDESALLYFPRELQRVYNGTSVSLLLVLVLYYYFYFLIFCHFLYFHQSFYYLA